MSILPAVRRALVDWLVNHQPVDHLEVPIPFVMSRAAAADSVPSTAECWTLAEAVHALWDDTAAAPSSVTDLLGVPPGTTFAAIARLLHGAHESSPDSTWAQAAWHLACGRIEPAGLDATRVAS